MNVRICHIPRIVHVPLYQFPTDGLVAVQVLEWAFGKRLTPAERLRKNIRLLDKAIREIDQVRNKLEKQEKTLLSQIKQSAQKGQIGACKIQAKDLIRTRNYVEKFYGLRSQLQQISLRLQVFRCRFLYNGQH